ncbi:hypothetical protein [Amycolatopsis sp. NPDC049159]|uniref:hypothetical protein n=1 Tax=unclassified Amycolatopsis TaxID=2618356 RepID=UPI0033DD4273
MASRVRGPGSEDRRELRIRHLSGCLPCTLKCAYCGLPVRLTGPGDHPGYGVVEEVIDPAESRPARERHATGATDRFGRDCGWIGHERHSSGDLVLLHRFCRGALGRCRTRGCVLRRAHLGRATEQYETGRRRPGRYQRLGVRRSADLDLYRKHWRVAKMRYACKACRYYTGSH